MKQSEREGLLYTALSYLIWGLLPIYWKLMAGVSPDEILTNRIFWSFWFMMIVVLLSRKSRLLADSIRLIRKKPKTMAALIAASLLISCNWLLYIWAVNSDHMVEASLGYYINPLVSILLGVFVLKEKLSAAQVASFFLALAGVLVLTLSYGQFPWAAFGLAFSFGLYGLTKKLITVDSAIGLTLETLAVMPLALLYMVYLFIIGEQSLLSGSIETDLLLVGAGAATAVPLLYFSKGVQKIPLYLSGFLQYIAPTMMLLLGVFLYKEPFSGSQLIAFICIWGSLVLLTITKIDRSKWKKGHHSKSLAQ